MPAKEVGRSIYPVLLDREYLTVCLNIWIHAGAARRVCSARSVHFVPKLPRSQTIANCSKNSAKPGLQPRPVAIYLEKKNKSHQISRGPCESIRTDLNKLFPRLLIQTLLWTLRPFKVYMSFRYYASNKLWARSSTFCFWHADTSNYIIHNSLW